MNTKNRDVIWVTWEEHIRTRTLCSHYKIELKEFISRGKFPFKHLKQLIITAIYINKTRPKILIVQNPSLILSFFVTLSKPFYKYKLIIDAHNEAIEPLNKNPALMLFKNWIIRHSDITIVTNKYLSKNILKKNGHPIILPDKLPSPKFTADKNFFPSEKLNITLMATYAKDEPIENIIKAASIYSSKISLYITGNSNKLSNNIKLECSDNIIFTGFLTENSYWDLLKKSDAIIDLSLKTNCLVCGAYEATAIEKPMILSDNPACRDYFNQGVVYTDASIKNISNAFSYLINNLPELEEEIKHLKIALEKNWETYGKTLEKELSTL